MERQGLGRVTKGEGRCEGNTTLWSAAVVAAVATLAAVVLQGGAAAPAQAGSPEDAVLDWNLNAINALVNAPPTAPVPGNPPGAGQSPQVSIS